MAKYPEKTRKSKHAKHTRYEINEHISGTGKPKKKMLPQHAKAVAARSGMNAYKCGVCQSFHVGRSVVQMQEDGWKKGRRR